MLKCSRVRCVCAPQSLAAGTLTGPRLSCSTRVAVMADPPGYRSTYSLTCSRGRPSLSVFQSVLAGAPGLWFSGSRGVFGEDKVARFDLLVAGKAGSHKRRFGRSAVAPVEMTEPP